MRQSDGLAFTASFAFKDLQSFVFRACARPFLGYLLLCRVLREPLINSGSWHTAPLIRGPQYGRAAELRDARLCGQGEAHEARRFSNRDGGGRAVAGAGSSD